MPFTTTTRLTSPVPTGWDKVFQDEWDVRREEQVRTKMLLDAHQSFINFMVNLKSNVDVVANGPICSADEPRIATVYGSYDVIDKSEKNDKWLIEQIKRINKDNKMLLNAYMRKKNVVCVKHGIRETGIIEYEDGSYDVCDPTKGIRCGAGKEIKSIRQIATLYCGLIRIPTGMPYPVA